MDNIFNVWKKFRRGKANKTDVMKFELHLEDNLFCLFSNLQGFGYKHSAYSFFQVFDNKKRDIYKAKVRDKIIHQIIYDYLLSLFDPEFISDSYSSRLGKGQYKAVGTFRYFIKLNYARGGPCFVLKCDVKKYFDNIDQELLLKMIKEKINCKKTFAIVEKVVRSYTFAGRGKGIPLGNVTSQIFANIYLHNLDIFVKNRLGCRFYLRYNDDFVIVSDSKQRLEKIRNKVIAFAKNKLFLEIPFEKTSIRKADWGIDFLGFTVLPRAVLLRNKTKNKIYTNMTWENIHSYFGILKHCNSHNLKTKLLSMERRSGIW